MNTQKTAPDFGEPWNESTTWDELVTRDGIEILYAASDMYEPYRSRAISCVNACAGMSDPAAEIQALRDAVKEARAFINRMRPSLLNLEHDDYVTRYGVSQEYATSEEAINEALSKLQSIAQMSTPQTPAFGVWQPIETAPKNGTWFLAYRPHGAVNEPEIKQARWKSECEVFGGHGWTFPTWKRGQPTHWMPLPPPPQD